MQLVSKFSIVIEWGSMYKISSYFCISNAITTKTKWNLKNGTIDKNSIETLNLWESIWQKMCSQFPQIIYKLSQFQWKSQKSFYFGANWSADSKIYKEMQKVKNSWGNFEEEKQIWRIYVTRYQDLLGWPTILVCQVLRGFLRPNAFSFKT